MFTVKLVPNVYTICWANWKQTLTHEHLKAVVNYSYKLNLSKHLVENQHHFYIICISNEILYSV